MSNGNYMNYKRGDLVVYKSVGEMEGKYGYCPIKVGIIIPSELLVEPGFIEYHLAYRGVKRQLCIREIRNGEIKKLYLGGKRNSIRNIYQLAFMMDDMEAWRITGREVFQK